MIVWQCLDSSCLLATSSIIKCKHNINSSYKILLTFLSLRTLLESVAFCYYCSEESFPRLGQMIVDYEKPIKRLNEEFIPHSKVLERLKLSFLISHNLKFALVSVGKCIINECSCECLVGDRGRIVNQPDLHETLYNC